MRWNLTTANGEFDAELQAFAGQLHRTDDTNRPATDETSTISFSHSHDPLKAMEIAIK